MSTLPWPAVLDPLRLQELVALNILDTLSEQTYDDLVGIACMICDMPIGKLTLVAEKRQWFKARIGTDVRETPTEQFVCACAISEENLLIINDMTGDERTSTNIRVIGEPYLRFYAGVQLRLDTRFGVGTLCVLDTKPHPAGLTAGQIAALTALGRQATTLLKVRRVLAAGNSDDRDKAVAGEPLEKIADALLAAYDLNKSYNDELLEELLFSSLAHVDDRSLVKKDAGFHMFIDSMG